MRSGMRVSIPVRFRLVLSREAFGVPSPRQTSIRSLGPIESGSTCVTVPRGPDQLHGPLIRQRRAAAEAARGFSERLHCSLQGADHAEERVWCAGRRDGHVAALHPIHPLNRAGFLGGPIP